VGVLHLSDHFAWVEHQLKVKSFNLEVNYISISTIKFKYTLYLVNFYKYFILPRLSLCVYYILYGPITVTDIHTKHFANVSIPLSVCVLICLWAFVIFVYFHFLFLFCFVFPFCNQGEGPKVNP